MASLPFQSAILAPVATPARYVSFRLVPGADPRAALSRLRDLTHGLDTDAQTLVGIGHSTVARLGSALDAITGLHEVPAFEGALEPIPATPRALWLMLRGDDRGVLLHRSLQLAAAVSDAFTVDSVVEGFRHQEGRDLTGYEDGTENPKDERALKAAILASGGAGLAGSSFVAVQHWQHDLARFQQFPGTERDHIIGRRRSDNEEISDAPKFAHTKRTAQESFEPEAFMVRRSLPWVDGLDAGLEFIAFGSSFYAFEVQLRRMVGLEDGIVDGLFRFSRPTATSYYWCPPHLEGRLDLRLLGL